jgi:formylglycine-generating enzyme required for sulfatase activity/tetratricopeptide (TPR) repeat protein
MQSIVCQVESQPDRIAFTWSQGKDSFEPYQLCGNVAGDFIDLAKELRAKLAEVVASYLDAAREPSQPAATEDHRRACLALARAGHELFRAVFDPGGAVKSQASTAKDVRKWLKKLQQLKDLVRLEIVHKGTQPLAVPWNVVYDTPPEQQAFLSAGESSSHWEPFWGVRYDLSGGPSVDPRRRMPWWGGKPRVWMVVDRDTGKGLPEDQRRALDEFRQRRGPVWIESVAQLEKELGAGRPDLIYWLGHADPSALYLDGESVTPKQLRRLLRADEDDEDEDRNAGLVFLNACQTAEAGESGSFLETFYHLGMCGLIATEHQTIDTFASPFGLDFLDAFLTRGEAIGPVLQRLRGRVPLGLLYGAYCPPDIRVVPPDGGGAEGVAVKEEAPRAGGTLGPGPTVRAGHLPLPAKPYCSLQYYDRADRALFTGRDADVRRFARLLDDAGTRLLTLHGETGVGKSSFLRAGVIPYLEEECVGYRFLNDRSQANDTAEPVCFVRATNDLTGQIAGAMSAFCARPFTSRTPAGKTLKVDLPAILRHQVGDGVDASAVRAAIQNDPALLGRLLAALGAALPFGIVLVIDQGEEVFTLARDEKDATNRRLALDVLRRTLEVTGNFKLIVALRTEYFGRFVDRLRRGAVDSTGVREYLLADFDEATLAEAVRRPTSDKAIPYASEVPFAKYGFRYADGVAEALAREVILYTTNRQDSALPLLQVICAQLHDRALQHADHVVRFDDLKALGGLKGGMRRHVYGLVARLFPSPKDREAFRQLLTGLYLRQPDGTLTTALMSADKLVDQWQGRTPFEHMLQAASSGEWRLLRVTSLRLGGEAERRYVSLGHDALAQVAAEWDDGLKRAARIRKLFTTLILMTAATILMVVVTLFALREWRDAAQKRDAALAANRQRAAALVEQLGTADARTVPNILSALADDRTALVPLLRGQWNNTNQDRQHRMRAGMALLPVDPDMVRGELVNWMLEAPYVTETLLAREILAPQKDAVTAYLWARAEDTAEDAAAQEKRFRALMGLALFDPHGERWSQHAEFVVDHMLSTNPLRLVYWVEGLRPVRAALIRPLCLEFRTSQIPSRRELAAGVLADYTDPSKPDGGRPDVLADLLTGSDHRQFAILFPKLRVGGKASALLQKVLVQRLEPDWKDPPLNPTWAQPDASLQHEIEQSNGMLDERFALCQTLPLERFLAVSEALRLCGYRPVRLRPYSLGSQVRAAAVWTRDGRECRTALDKTADELRSADANNQLQGYRPEDVAGYTIPGNTGEMERYAAIWAQRSSPNDKASLFVGVTAAKLPPWDDNLMPRTYQVFRATGGEGRYSAIGGMTPNGPFHWYLPTDSFEREYVKRGSDDKVHVDVSLHATIAPKGTRERFLEQLDRADKSLKDDPTNLNVKPHLDRGEAFYRLGEFEKAISELTVCIKWTEDAAKLTSLKSSFADAHKIRALAYAAVGKPEEAKRDLAEVRHRAPKARNWAHVDAIVAAYLAEDAEGMRRLEAILAEQGADGYVVYNAACAYAQVSGLLTRDSFGGPGQVRAEPGTRLARANRYAERAIDLLRQAFAKGYPRNTDLLRTDPDLDPLRRRPGFAQCLRELQLDRQYAAVWHGLGTHESTESHGLSPAEHLARGKALASQGYRPVALSVLAVAEGRPLLTASTWQRPVVSDMDREALAKRQALAAVALLRLGLEDRVWPLFQRQAPDPTLRSYLVAQLEPSGVEAELLVRRLLQGKDPPSARLAIILALGEYGPDQLPPAVRGPLTSQLVEWYQNDPDPGIHGATDWLLRHSREGHEPRKLDWGQAETLLRIDERLRGRHPQKNERCWYVSGQGQTMVRFPPCESRMGSPAHEQGRGKTELRHTRFINRTFALATTSVTFEQWQRFRLMYPKIGPALEEHEKPEPGGPMLGLTWYEAAQYCRWLSDQESLPEDQMCYPSVDEIERAKKSARLLKLPPNYLSRTGYRLPTEAEWEYACRAGTATPWYYGSGQELLPRYAWFLRNSEDRAWPVGQKRPNDFGFFDMHGLVWNWRQDDDVARPEVGDNANEDVEDTRDVNARVGRAYRGGSKSDAPTRARSASRNVQPPTLRLGKLGLRVARTMP